ncbi:hypothetical protein JNB_17223 [Janibacter sp. HTCC2649]|uniref:VanZ family protein n=1 Tax=Janibacter sp. HTCC2649 TaxID=313589 RepID=UPI0000670EC3|nr:VanZ family protein [Janibacter sp. HTCC2649]EAP97233.1 hypothetical protein JNB_17223 [Janibacter sp. HTCC2649]
MTPSRRPLIALFGVYLALLVWVVMWKLEWPSVGGGVRNVKLTPFVTASNGDGASQPMEVVGNLLLFVPLGIYLALLAPKSPRWRLTLLAGSLSAGMEIAQYVLAVGRTDITDVIVNTAGAVVGMGLVALVQHGTGTRARRLLTRACLAGTALAVAACATFVALPIRYGPPDVRCDSQGSCRVGHDLDR